jgi:hypothetical protein
MRKAVKKKERKKRFKHFDFHSFCFQEKSESESILPIKTKKDFQNKMLRKSKLALIERSYLFRIFLGSKMNGNQNV